MQNMYKILSHMIDIACIENPMKPSETTPPPPILPINLSSLPHFNPDLGCYLTKTRTEASAGSASILNFCLWRSRQILSCFWINLTRNCYKRNPFPIDVRLVGIRMDGRIDMRTVIRTCMRTDLWTNLGADMKANLSGDEIGDCILFPGDNCSLQRRVWDNCQHGHRVYNLGVWSQIRWVNHARPQRILKQPVIKLQGDPHFSILTLMADTHPRTSGPSGNHGSNHSDCTFIVP